MSKFKFVLDFKQEEEIYSGEIEAEDVDHARDLILEELELGLSVQDNISPKKKTGFKEIKIDDFLKMLDGGRKIEVEDEYYAQECYGDEAFKIPFGTWSDIKKILHAEKEEKDSYNINLSRGSFPLCRKELIKDRFKFYKLI